MKILRSVLRRERAISEICKVKGWDPNNLTPHQLAQIVEVLGRDQRGRPSRKAR